jgi:Nucleotidyl transferase AbiEii toxin, Type IV TA system
MGEGLAEWVITTPGGLQLTVQLAYFDRSHEAVAMEIGPVLDLEDVAGGKVCALASRVEPRDYADTARMLERFSPAALIGFARRLDPGLTARDFADAGRQLDRIDDDAFTRYGLTRRDVVALRDKFATWPHTPRRRPAR